MHSFGFFIPEKDLPTFPIESINVYWDDNSVIREIWSAPITMYDGPEFSIDFCSDMPFFVEVSGVRHDSYYTDDTFDDMVKLISSGREVTAEIKIVIYKLLQNLPIGNEKNYDEFKNKLDALSDRVRYLCDLLDGGGIK